MGSRDAVRVSVIIPVYNTLANLRQCLDSVLAQTERNIEVICVDDGSTDGSLDILKEYATSDDRVIVLRQEHLGGGAARNRAIEEARGRYLSFLDADDFFVPELLETAANALDETDADVAVYRSWVFREEDHSVYDAEWTYRADLIPDKEVFTYHDMPDSIFNTFANVPWNKMFRSSFVRERKIRFQPIQRTNDLLFVCSALVLAQGIVAIDKHLAYYRMGTSSSCQATNDRAPLAFFEAFLALKEFLVKEGLFEQLERSFAKHALDGIIANLNSQNTLEGFRSLYSARVDFERQFGIREHEDANYDKTQFAEYTSMLDSDEAAFLFGRLKTVQMQRDEAWRANRTVSNQKRDAEKKNEELRDDLADLRKELALLAEQNDSLERSYKELSDELVVLRSSRSYRIGRTITAPFRRMRSFFA